MSYIKNIRYLIYKCDKNHNFDQMVDSLLSQIPECVNVIRLVFFGSVNDNIEYQEYRGIIKEHVDSSFVKNKPIFSLVAQSPLDCGLALEVHCLDCDTDYTIDYKEYKTYRYVIFENEEVKILFAGGFQSDLNLNLYDQSKNVFNDIGEVLSNERFGINSIVRQWNYIEDITLCQGHDQHYQMFNNARSEFYSSVSWDNGYPAATGIGSSCGGVLIDFDAVIKKTDKCDITPIDNKLQVAAHAYSDNVLLEAGKNKTTPKFERAKSLSLSDGRIVYISGTAAIRGEESLTGVGISRQLIITLENIQQLIGNSNIALFRVYLKNKEFYNPVHDYFLQRGLDISISYLLTDVCRDELLIEIEGIAIEW